MMPTKESAMSEDGSGSARKSSASVTRRDPYEVLGVAQDASDQQIKAAYKKMALKYHPDKNANDHEAAELFKEVAYSYSILSDQAKRKQYDTAGFEALELEGFDMELDLSNLGTVNTMFAALFSKLGVPIKTTVSASVLEEALSGTVTIRPLPLGRPFHDRVEKQGAHYYGVTISDAQADAGVVIRVTSSSQSKFKLLYFEQEESGGLNIISQEDSVKAGKVTTAGMYFLHFQVYHLDPIVNAMTMAKDPEAAFFKKLDGLQPCEVSSLKGGTHIFAVYGDNFFKNASYTIEVVCADSYSEVAEKLKNLESQLLSKQSELHQFESEYRDVLARFSAVSTKFIQEKNEVDELLKKRDAVLSSFSYVSILKRSMSSSHMKYSNGDSKDPKDGTTTTHSDESQLGKERPHKKKWFNLNFKAEKKNT